MLEEMYSNKQREKRRKRETKDRYEKCKIKEKQAEREV
jgi:hypothetical protein